MQKYILYIALLQSIITFTAEVSHTVKETSPLIIKYQPITLGNITLESEQLKILSDEERANLTSISNPSCILKCYGLDNHILQPENGDTLKKIIKKYPTLFNNFTITTKTRNANECCTKNSVSCAYLDICGRCKAILSLGAFGIGSMIPACADPMTYTMIALLSAIPAGYATTELGNCLCYRYCTEEKEYETKKQ